MLIQDCRALSLNMTALTSDFSVNEIHLGAMCNFWTAFHASVLHDMINQDLTDSILTPSHSTTISPLPKKADIDVIKASRVEISTNHVLNVCSRKFKLNRNFYLHK